MKHFVLAAAPFLCVVLAAGQARAGIIAKGFCDERATLPAAKITSQVAAFIYLRLLA